MAEIEISTLRELLELRGGEEDSLRLTGERWGLNILLADFLSLPAGLVPTAGHLLRLASLARAAVPFDWLAMLYGTELEAQVECRRAYRHEVAKPPRTVFVATLLEILAYTREPWLLDNTALEKLHAHLQCAWCLMLADRSMIYAGSWLVRKASRLYAPAACPNAAIILLCRVRTLVENQLAQEGSHDLSLHESNACIAALICELLWDLLKVEQPLTREERLQALRSQLDNEVELSPEASLRVLDGALAAWEREADQQGRLGEMGEQRRRFQLVLEFLRLTYRFARAEAADTWPDFEYQELASLADGYESAGLSPADVLCRAVDHITYCCQKSPKHAGDFRDAIERLGARLMRLPDRFLFSLPTVDEALRRIAKCYISLGEPERARPYVTFGVKRTVAVLPAAADRHTKSYFLRGCGEWLGDAFLISGMLGERPRADRFFDDIYRLMHKRPWSGREAPVEAWLLQAAVAGSCIILRASEAGDFFEEGLQTAPDCFVTLQLISEAADRDIAHFEKTKQIPDEEREREWRELTRRFLAQLPLEGVLAKARRTSDGPRRVLVETELSGMHVPWCGFLAESDCRPEAVLVADLAVDEEQTRPMPDADAGIVVLNCFAEGELLYGQFRQLAEELGAGHVQCDSISVFRHELQARSYKLVVTAGHGSQDRFLGKLTLQIGGAWHSAEKVWQGVRLASASVVASFICYGGGGHSGATGEFGSVASLALRAGSQAAVTSRWPAWIFADTAGRYRVLFADLAALAPHGNTWRLAEVVMRFVYAMRAYGLWNSLGWGMHVPSRRDSPH